MAWHWHWLWPGHWNWPGHSRISPGIALAVVVAVAVALWPLGYAALHYLFTLGSLKWDTLRFPLRWWLSEPWGQSRVLKPVSMHSLLAFLRFHMLKHRRTHSCISHSSKHTRAYLEILKMRYKDTFGLPTISAVWVWWAAHTTSQRCAQQDGQPFRLRTFSYSQSQNAVMAPIPERAASWGWAQLDDYAEMCASRPAEVYFFRCFFLGSFSSSQNVHWNLRYLPWILLQKAGPKERRHNPTQPSSYS